MKNKVAVAAKNMDAFAELFMVGRYIDRLGSVNDVRALTKEIQDGLQGALKYVVGMFVSRYSPVNRVSYMMYADAVAAMRYEGIEDSLFDDVLLMGKVIEHLCKCTIFDKDDVLLNNAVYSLDNLRTRCVMKFIGEDYLSVSEVEYLPDQNYALEDGDDA